MSPTQAGATSAQNRGTIRSVLFASALVTMAWSLAPCTQAQAASAAVDVSGVWWAGTYRSDLVPTDGKAIPLTTQGRAAYAENVAMLKKGPAADTAHSDCVPQGVPRSLLAPYPFRIFQSASQVVFIHEANRAFRIVRVADKHADPDVWDPSYMGEGIARLEDGALVIDTNNFNAKTWLDDAGLPHSEHLRTVERLRKINNGLELEDVVTIEDPEMFTAPWSARLVFRSRPEVVVTTDWVCGEAHRDISSVKGGVAYR